MGPLFPLCEGRLSPLPSSAPALPQVMKGDSDGAGGGKAIARSVEMIEQILNSGNIDKEDLESLKAMLSKSMGMPVEEVLERKEELQKELPPEGKKLFDLIERLFAKDGGGEMKSAEAADSEVDPDLLGADEMKVAFTTGNHHKSQIANTSLQMPSLMSVFEKSTETT